ncbi:uncharacterized protein LOC105698298 isoform X2 [Orussus abietinus]|uniref:uncharacterized protein LOC105698298 isoform X2 n=1 Tax=Orussus abietinus TaxID=222816 RepID=UPI000625371A|nr:uncharacterized protein LOC105698298 isoform X2 [Orussus abietinus]
MDSLSDSSRCELDSVTSSDSLQLITDEFHLQHASTPDISSIVSSKRISSLELENERLRVALEHIRLELDAKTAANRGLKDKITEMYLEAHNALLERQQLQNSIKDAIARFTVAEGSVKWYKHQLHNMQAGKRTLQLEIDTHREIARRKQRALTELTAKCNQWNAEYAESVEKFKRENRILRTEIEALTLDRNKDNNLHSNFQDSNFEALSINLSEKLRATETELRETKEEFQLIEQRLLCSEATKSSIENALSNNWALISSMESTSQKCESEKNELMETLKQTRVEVRHLRDEKQKLQITLLSAKQERNQVEEAIVLLRSRLSKMITQYKTLKKRNAEVEDKLNSMEELKNENKRLKTLSFAANASLFKKLREAKCKNRKLENQLRNIRVNGHLNNMKIKTDASMRECLNQALQRNRELQDQLQSMLITKTPDESIDEGYGDSTVGTMTFDLSPHLLEPTLLDKVNRVLAESKDFLAPMESSLNELQTKFENFIGKHRAQTAQLFSTNRHVDSMSSVENAECIT